MSEEWTVAAQSSYRYRPTFLFTRAYSPVMDSPSTQM